MARALVSKVLCVIDLIHTDHYLPLVFQVKEVVTITMKELLKGVMTLFPSCTRDMAEVSMFRRESLDKLVAFRILILIKVFEQLLLSRVRFFKLQISLFKAFFRLLIDDLYLKISAISWPLAPLLNCDTLTCLILTLFHSAMKAFLFSLFSSLSSFEVLIRQVLFTFSSTFLLTCHRQSNCAVSG